MKPMMKQHLRMHGQTRWVHFRNNWQFTVMALKAAGYTFGHGLTPRISGRRAAELHNELWDLGRVLSIEDITHRLDVGLYATRSDALADFEALAAVYDETQRFVPFRAVVEARMNTANAWV